MDNFQKMLLTLVVVTIFVITNVHAMKFLHRVSANYASPDVLLDAIRAGDEVYVGICLEHGADSNTPGTCGHTPLRVAAAGSSLPIVAMLLERNADVNAADRDGVTPLAAAVTDGYPEIVQRLIDARADVNGNYTMLGSYATVLTGSAPLLSAAYRGDVRIMERLLKSKADVTACGANGTALHIAAYHGHAELVTLLLQYGAEKDRQASSTKDTPLTKAIVVGHDRVVKVLIDAKADLEARGYQDYTPLGCAVSRDKKRIVCLLLQAKASVETPCSFSGKTCLNYAVSLGHVTSACLLMHAGADYTYALQKYRYVHKVESEVYPMDEACKLYAKDMVQDRDAESCAISDILKKTITLPSDILPIVCEYAIYEPDNVIMAGYFNRQVRANAQKHASLRYRASHTKERLSRKVKVWTDAMMQGARGRVDGVMGWWRSPVSRNHASQATVAEVSEVRDGVPRCAACPNCACARA